MPERIHAPHVGAPDPELRCSPILSETDDEAEALTREMPETPVCYFNGTAYDQGSYVCSGSDLLRCAGGVWVGEGSCDPDNP